MKTSKWLLTTTLAAAIAFTSLSIIASADDGEQPAEAGERQQIMEQVQAAVDSGDYNAFAEVAPEKMLEYINADNFERFVEMHNHLESAKEIAEELGLPNGRQMLQKAHQKGVKHGKFMENREEIKEAVENGDYDAWVALHEDGEREAKILEYINEDNFHLLAELHEAIQNQDFETAQAIKEELGMPLGEGHTNS